MKLNSPLPQPLPKECLKAAKIFKSFVDSGNNGLDGVIPRQVLDNAKGFAIFTIFKAGFLFSARAGAGIVIARLNDGSWSAPSAIGTGGLGVGGQAGAEMTDFLVVLNSRAAVRSFMSAGSLTLGGNMSIALGPLGRNGEASGSLNTSGKVAAMYSYSKTRGLFGGLSIEGSVIMERQDANVQAYKSPVTAKLLLGGMVEPPPWASHLIDTLQNCTGMPGNRKWVQEGNWVQDDRDNSYAFEGMASPGAEPSTPSYLRKKKNNDKGTFPPASWGRKNSDVGSYFTSELDDEPQNNRTRSATWDRGASSSSANFATQFESDFAPEKQQRTHPRFNHSISHTPQNDLMDSPNPFEPSTAKTQARPHARSMSAATYSSNAHYPKYRTNFTPNSWDRDMDTIPPLSEQNFDSSTPYILPTSELAKPLPPHQGVARAIALYDFRAVESGDLSFYKGEVITITQKSDSSDDWWTGKIDGRDGIFPANFVEVV